MVPSRFESFSLVALEALLSGCVVAIGVNSGIVDFLKEGPHVVYLDDETLSGLHTLLVNTDNVELRISEGDISAITKCFSHDEVFSQWNSMFEVINA